MAKLISAEKNVSVELQLHEIEECADSDFETWVICSLSLDSKAFKCNIKPNGDFTLNQYELKELINDIFTILDCLEKSNYYICEFSNLEMNFQIKMETIIEDGIIEIEIWINMGNYTNGKDAAYDVGLRFDVEKIFFYDFYYSISNEMRSLFGEDEKCNKSGSDC